MSAATIAAPLIRAYYDACSTGDADGVAATVTDDVVHCFLAPNLATPPDNRRLTRRRRLQGAMT